MQIPIDLTYTGNECYPFVIARRYGEKPTDNYEVVAKFRDPYEAAYVLDCMAIASVVHVKGCAPHEVVATSEWYERNHLKGYSLNWVEANGNIHRMSPSDIEDYRARGDEAIKAHWPNA